MLRPRCRTQPISQGCEGCLPAYQIAWRELRFSCFQRRSTPLHPSSPWRVRRPCSCPRPLLTSTYHPQQHNILVPRLGILFLRRFTNSPRRIAELPVLGISRQAQATFAILDFRFLQVIFVPPPGLLKCLLKCTLISRSSTAHHHVIYSNTHRPPAGVSHAVGHWPCTTSDIHETADHGICMLCPVTWSFAHK